MYSKFIVSNTAGITTAEINAIIDARVELTLAYQKTVSEALDGAFDEASTVRRRLAVYFAVVGDIESFEEIACPGTST